MAARRRNEEPAVRKLRTRNKQLKLLSAGLIIVIAVLAIYTQVPAINTAVNGQPFGQRLTGINNPLNPQQLSAINNAPIGNFETAGQMLLNLSLPGETLSNGVYQGAVDMGPTSQVRPFMAGGKPSVIYIGAISCIFCGENRWAMALALSRFGSFNSLYNGYSSLGDGDVPTLYWKKNNVTTAGIVTYGSNYSSSYINFIPAEYDSPITSGFQLPNLADPINFYIESAPNSTYSSAMMFMNSTNLFAGTPVTLWGTVVNRGADGSVFGPTNTKEATNYPGITFMTADNILNQLKSFNTTLSWQEYAAADVYVAQTCPSINNSAPVCRLPAIQGIEAKMGLA